MRYLSVEDVIFINRQVVEHAGGLIGIRDIGLIDSAVNRPKATFNGKDLHPSLFEKSAVVFIQ